MDESRVFAFVRHSNALFCDYRFLTGGDPPNSASRFHLTFTVCKPPDLLFVNLLDLCYMNSHLAQTIGFIPFADIFLLSGTIAAFQ